MLSAFLNSALVSAFLNDAPPVESMTEGDHLQAGHRGSAAEWLARARDGSCGITNDWVEGDCLGGDLGSFRLTEAESTSLETAAAACLRACELCDRCRHISVSAQWKDCAAKLAQGSRDDEPAS